jgi:hypothetical protein
MRIGASASSRHLALCCAPALLQLLVDEYIAFAVHNVVHKLIPLFIHKVFVVR